MYNGLWIVLLVLLGVGVGGFLMSRAFRAVGSAEIITLPGVREDGTVSLEKAIKMRRSIRDYQITHLSLTEISQLLWAAQGVTEDHGGLRAAPSAGALHPIELYVVAGSVDGLDTGVYKYKNTQKGLSKIVGGDKRRELSDASLAQSWVLRAPANIVICGVHERVERKYGERAHRFVSIEAGAVAQNIYLQAAVLNLGTVLVGTFDDAKVATIIGAAKGEVPLAILPVGKV